MTHNNTSADDSVRAAVPPPAPFVVAAAIACSLASTVLMNRVLFPLFDGVFTYARDVSITVEALALICLAVAALWRPSVVRGRLLNAFSCILCVAGTATMGIGLAAGSAVVLAAGAVLAVTGRAWSWIVANMAAVALPLPTMFVSVLTGTLVAQLLQAILGGLPPMAGTLLAMVVLPLTSVALCAGPAESLMADIAASKPVADVSVTRPFSFVPLTHTLYVFQFVMYIAYGFALRFGEVGGSPLFGTALIVLAIAALLAVVVAKKGSMPFDGLCNVAVLLLLAGFILVLVNVQAQAYGANTLLAVGNALYGALITCTMVALSGRNRAAALSILCWATGIAALGTTLGALVGTTGNALLARGDADIVAYMVGGVTIVLMAYILFFLRGFSFAKTINGVEATEPNQNQVSDQLAETIGASSEDDLFVSSCEQIAAEYGLTPREAQTFEMLARGRDREYIESELQVSRNTVKAHVKHIYAKLEVHSHLELIDLVMRQMRNA